MIARPAEVPSRSTHLLTVNEIRHDTAPAGGAAPSRGGGLKRVCASFDAPTARLRASFDAPKARLRASFDAQWAAVSKPHPEGRRSRCLEGWSGGGAVRWSLAAVEMQRGSSGRPACGVANLAV